MLVVVVSDLLSGRIAQMRSKATLPLPFGVFSSIHLFIWDSVFFFAFVTIKGSELYLSGLRKESRLHSTSG